MIRLTFYIINNYKVFLPVVNKQKMLSTRYFDKGINIFHVFIINSNKHHKNSRQISNCFPHTLRLSIQNPPHLQHNGLTRYIDQLSITEHERLQPQFKLHVNILIHHCTKLWDLDFFQYFIQALFIQSNITGQDIFSLVNPEKEVIHFCGEIWCLHTFCWTKGTIEKKTLKITYMCPILKIRLTYVFT